MSTLSKKDLEKIWSKSKDTFVSESDAPSVAKSGSYNDLKDKPTIPSIDGLASENYVNTELAKKQDKISTANKLSSSLVTGLATVATSGSYNDLKDKPATNSTSGFATENYVNTEVAKKEDKITATNKLSATLVDGLATIATSGSYDDLSNKPTIPTVPTKVSAFTNDSKYQTESDLTTALSSKQDTISSTSKLSSNLVSGLADVATSGSYNDLKDKPSQGTNVSVEQLLTSGVEIAKVTVDGSTKTLFAPQGGGSSSGGGSSVSVSPLVTDGTSLATINVDGAGYTIKAPTIPTNVSSFTNDANYQTASDVSTTISSKQDKITNTNKLSTSYISGLADVATSGKYEDLKGTPTIPSITGLASTSYVDSALEGKQDTISSSNKLSSSFVSGLSTVATSGSYTDLSNKPTIPTKVSSLTNDSKFQTESDLTTALSYKQDTISLSNKLDNTLVSGLSTVATSGSYSDLSNKPTIPTKVSSLTNDSKFQTESDLTTALSSKQDTISSTSKLSATLVSGLSSVATSGSYTDLSNKPTIPTVPTKVSAFTNDANYVNGTDLETAVSVKQNLITDKNKVSATLVDGLADVATSGSYNDLSDKPDKSKVSFSQVMTSGVEIGKITIDNTETSIFAPQSVISEGGSGGSSVSVSPLVTEGTSLATINVDGAGYTIKAPTIPTNVSSFTNDANYVTSDAINGKQDEITTTNKLSSSLVDGLSTVATSGSYSDLSNKPTIPTKVSSLTNDSKYQTESDLATALSSKQDTISATNKVSSAHVSGLSSVATSGSYDDLTNKPTSISTFTNDANYQTDEDLTTALADKQDAITTSSKLSATLVSGLSTVATSGSYTDLSNKPTIPTKVSTLTNDSKYQTESDLTTALSSKQDAISSTSKLSATLVSGLASVATSGSYDDLSNKPTIPTNVSSLTNDSKFQTESDVATTISSKQDKITDSNKLGASLVSGLADVATSGSYNDLSDKPTIPSISGLATTNYVDTEIGKKQNTISATNKLSATFVDGLSTVATSGSYSDLSNKPTIPSTDGLATTEYVNTEVGKKQNTISATNMVSSAFVSGLSSVATSGSYDDLSNKPTIPTTTSQLTNNSNFVVDSEYVHTDNNYSNTEKGRITTIEGVIPTAATSSNKLVDENSMFSALRKHQSAYISSSESGVVPFKHATYIGDKKSNLENGPWYKQGKLCGSDKDTLVQKDDYAIVTEDESVCFCFINGFKYQRKKDGGATLYGTVDLPNDENVEIGKYPSDPTVDGYLYFVDNSHVIFEDDVVIVITSVNVLKDSVWLCNWNGNIATSLGSIIGKYDLNFPTTQYICTTSQFIPSEEEKATGVTGNPIWSFSVTMNDFTISEENLTAMNSGITSELVRQISTNETAISSKQDAITTTNKLSSSLVSGLSDVATSGSYNDLSDKPTIPSISGLASETYVGTAVSTHNSANDAHSTLFSNKQDKITATSMLDSSLVSGLADVATSGDYNDLTNKPTIPSISGLATTNYVDTEVGKKQNTISATSKLSSTLVSGLSDVATSGSYNDLSDKPTIPSISGLATETYVGTSVSTHNSATDAHSTLFGNKQDKITSTNKLSTSYISGLSTVATSGSYDDLSNKPTIPTVPSTISSFTNDAKYQTESDVATTISSKQDSITDKNKLSANLISGLSAVATSGSYTDLSDKPTIPSITGLATETYVNEAIGGKVDASELATVATSGSYNDLSDKPTIPSISGLASETYVGTAISTHNSATDAHSTLFSGKQDAITTTNKLSSSLVDGLSSVATSGSYNDLSDKPTINDTTFVELTESEINQIWQEEWGN